MTQEKTREFRGYILDDFQSEAVDHLMNGYSVLVSAPTGVGKTLIADYLIEQAIKDQRRVVYTAPIKALSNQKYKEFKEWYGSERVGIITGDVVINPEAEIVIMTTEIFRNILHQEKERLYQFSHVVFDEIHYLSDLERGTVWEESIIFMPDNLRLLGLSATIPNADELAAWIQEIKGHPVKVVYKKDRVVPLEHYVYHPLTGVTTMKNLKKVWRERKKKEGGYPSGISRKNDTNHKELVRALYHRDGLPALYFIFSRQQCEVKAYELSEEFDFLTPGEKEKTREILAGAAAKYNLEKWQTLHRLKDLYLKGIGFHHAGMLPALKEIVETLFGEGLIRVMYATETFAVGINYPVRSVCFDSPTKWDGVTFRPMTTLEYFQMAGRAGRRGIDERGFVYILADPDRYRWEEFPSTNVNDVEELTSRFNLSYNSVLNLFSNYSYEEILVILNRNFATHQARNSKIYLEKRLSRLQAQLEKIRGVICEDWGNLCCPQARAVALRQLRKKERRLRFIRGKKARRAIAAEVRELKKSLAEMAERNCSEKEQARCQKRAKKYEELYRERLNLEERMGSIKVAGRFEADLQAKTAILEDLNYLEPEGKLLPRGKFAMQIYAQELLITELYFSGFFHEWDEDQINAVIVAIDYEPRKGERIPRRLPFELRPIKKIIRDLIFRYGVGEEEIRFFPSLSPLAYEWSKGCDFMALTRLAPDLQEGDIVSGFQRGIDLLRQIRSACLGEDPLLAAKIKNYMDKMDRDLVQVNL